ncbi:MAG: nitronate monooxygenase [Acidobacteriaceae bacterium]|nr:nitronate monooxygenase [Acidobacteriaceae bacterium]
MSRQGLRNKGGQTALTNVFTGRPARAIATRMVRETGPMSNLAPDFPLAAGFSAPLRVASEANGSTDFTPIWCGQSVGLARELSAKEITQRLAAETLARLSSCG